MKIIDLEPINTAQIGKNVVVECEEFIYQGHFCLEDNVKISAKKIYLGNNVKIETNTRVSAIDGCMDLLSLGDETLLGFNTQIMVPEFILGDYSRIFNASLCSGYKPIRIGHNCWIGQSTILNSMELLRIGNNVRMGGNSQIWTHVASGELLEGCRFYGQKPVSIEDNVWLMGFGHTVSPGVVLARNTIVMSGSVVTKSTEPYHTYSGIPAQDVTAGLNGWSQPKEDEKFVMLQQFIEEFIVLNPDYAKRVFSFDLSCCMQKEKFAETLQVPTPCLLFIKKIERLKDYADLPHSLFDLASKTYLKTRSTIETAWMKFALGYRARFIPEESADA